MEKDLMKEIERLRQEMVKKATELGTAHPTVLRLSREIDLLHTELTKKEMKERYKQKKDKNNKLLELNWSFTYASF